MGLILVIDISDGTEATIDVATAINSEYRYNVGSSITGIIIGTLILIIMYLAKYAPPLSRGLYPELNPLCS